MQEWLSTCDTLAEVYDCFCHSFTRRHKHCARHISMGALDLGLTTSWLQDIEFTESLSGQTSDPAFANCLLACFWMANSITSHG